MRLDEKYLMRNLPKSIFFRMNSWENGIIKSNLIVRINLLTVPYSSDLYSLEQMGFITLLNGNNRIINVGVNQKAIDYVAKL